VFERLGLADTGERIASRIVDELVDAFESLSVLGLPVDVILPPVRIEGD
jgi:hypothetical protein